MGWARRHIGVSAGRDVGRKAQPPRLIVALTLVLAPPVWAVEADVHAVVAQLMLTQLQPSAKAGLEALYGSDWRRELVERAPQLELELQRHRNAHLRPLQQTLFEIGAEEFRPADHCPNNACSVAAVLESRQVLLQSNFTDNAKQQAARYLMHYMVELHSPVNVGLKRDEGGQKIYLKNAELQPVNFAWIWNHDLYRQQNLRWFSYAQELYRTLQSTDTSEWVATTDVPTWAFETHQLAITEVYPWAAKERYSAEMMAEGQKILERLWMKAAVRTAALFNEIYPEPEAEMAAE